MAGEEDKDFDSFTLISTTSDGKAGFSDKLKAGKEWLQQKQASMKAWGEFFNLRRLSKPTSVGHATGRVLTNIRHFSTNYLFVFLGLAVYCVVTNPLLLIALAVCGAVYWFLSIKNRGENLRLLGRDCAPVEIYTVMGGYGACPLHRWSREYCLLDYWCICGHHPCSCSLYDPTYPVQSTWR